MGVVPAQRPYLRVIFVGFLLGEAIWRKHLRSSTPIRVRVLCGMLSNPNQPHTRQRAHRSHPEDGTQQASDDPTAVDPSVVLAIHPTPGSHTTAVYTCLCTKKRISEQGCEVSRLDGIFLLKKYWP